MTEEIIPTHSAAVSTPNNGEATHHTNDNPQDAASPVDEIEPDSLDAIFEQDYDNASNPQPIEQSPAGGLSPVIPPSPCVMRAPTLTPKSSSTDQLPEVLPADVSSRVSAPIELKVPYPIPDIADYPSTSHLLIGMPHPMEILGPVVAKAKENT